MAKLAVWSFGFLFAVGALGLSIPPLTGPVVDQAQILSADTREQLSNLLRRVNQSGKAQIQVLTLETLDGESIEQASIKIADQWKLGSKKVDNGVLFIIALAERKIRIEVGRGLEGDLTDLVSGRIVRNVVSPLFKQRRYSEGVTQGVLRIIEQVAPQFLDQKEFTNLEDNPTTMPPHVLLFLLIWALLFGFGMFRRYRYGGGSSYSGWGGGGWGGGFGGGSGGGWSGGGGGFSGGGASGDW